ncbi:unnamed protein product [Chilo suppressalis]|uniref:Uncharacterized protein n=1 Tax=Chilo suppressalis TaxID=168631 RepID=A0ABN8B0T6_CHISP|nr:unnamed protein product [Chilo suppressalis]
MYLYLITPAVAYILFKSYQKWTCGMYTDPIKMSNKVVIVTGANTGIGFETAKDLAKRDARVILACRDTDKGNAARNRIVNATGNNNVVYKRLDLASLQSVRDFSDDILSTERLIHVLINNAGTGKLDNRLTEDNLPVEAQVNHFGPFLLTNLLLPAIKAARGRIINVSSVMHYFGRIDIENFIKQAKTSFQHRLVYSNTKLANILFTRKLSKELQGSGVTVNCLHPGAVSTDIFRHQFFIVRLLIRFIMKTPYEGAQTSIYLAVAPVLENVTGKYFVDCQEVKPSKTAMDDGLAEKLWDLSERKVLNKKKCFSGKLKSDEE